MGMSQKPCFSSCFLMQPKSGRGPPMGALLDLLLPRLLGLVGVRGCSEEQEAGNAGLNPGRTGHPNRHMICEIKPLVQNPAPSGGARNPLQAQQGAPFWLEADRASQCRGTWVLQGMSGCEPGDQARGSKDSVHPLGFGGDGLAGTWEQPGTIPLFQSCVGSWHGGQGIHPAFSLFPNNGSLPGPG